MEPILRQHSDEALLRLVAQRNSAALEVLYDRHAQTIYNLITRIVRDPAAADDLLQDTFWQVWQAGDQSQFRGEGAAVAWLFRVARNKSLDHLRRQKARPQRTDSSSPENEQQKTDRKITVAEENVDKKTEELKNLINKVSQTIEKEKTDSPETKEEQIVQAEKTESGLKKEEESQLTIEKNCLLSSVST